MTRKQWGLCTLALLAACMLAIIGTVVLIDPFEIYHKAEHFIAPIENGTQNYSNAGIAKTYDYDSVVIGSSMTENFTPSQLDSLLGGSFIKLPINGGSPFNHAQMMELAFRTHDVQRVLYGIDVEALTWFYSTPKCEMPEYLYDDNLFNDAQYWFNKTVLAKFLPRCLRTLGQSDPNQRDSMYNWGSLYEYGEDAALREVRLTGKKKRQEQHDPVFSIQSQLNYEHNYLPFIEGHPQTEFIFFFPPYSLAQWYQFYNAGDLLYHLSQKEAVTEALLMHENVKVYDFQAQTAWILNLDNYIDASHYGPWINDAMAEAIAADEYRITDVSQVRENNDVIRTLTLDLRERTEWPYPAPSSVAP